MSNLDDFRSARIRTWPIVLLRVYTGIFFAYHGFGKLRRGSFADGLARFVEARLDDSVGFFRPFLESVVLPNASLLAFLVAWGELLVGLALVAGLLTRYAAMAGALMVLCFWMAKGQGLLDGQNHDAIWFVIFVVLAGLHAGRVAGLDRRLAPRYRFLE